MQDVRHKDRSVNVSPNVLSSSPLSAEDEEDTIAAQEKVEGNVDHAEELDDLAREGTCSGLV